MKKNNNQWQTSFLISITISLMMSCGVTNKNMVKSENRKSHTKSYNEITANLIDNGFFQYVDDSQIIEVISEIIDKNLANDNRLYFPSGYYIHDLKPEYEKYEDVESIDYRTLEINGEYIFRGGLKRCLPDFEPLFTKRGLIFNIGEEKENWISNAEFKHFITINNREYKMFDGNPERGNSEMIYLKNLVNILNEELNIQNWEKEKFVILTSLETVFFSIVTEKLEEYINSIEPQIKNKIIGKL